MSEAALILGPIAFQDFEIPSSIAFGGRQRTATHYLSSGRRITDALGPDDETISFAGVLSGGLAVARARDIDTLRSLGQPLVLVWNTFSYSVLLTSFQAQYRNQWWIPYNISCTVLTNPSVMSDIQNLSAPDEAAAALNLMYEAVPAAFLPFADLRLPISAAAVQNSPTSINMAIARLSASAALLATARTNTEASLARLSTVAPIAVDRALTNLTALVGMSRELQYLALAQDCLAQASAHLR